MNAQLQPGYSPAPSGRWLRPLGGSWPSALCQLLEAEPAVVRVVVAAIRGSAPREAGACMLVSAHETLGTIGGGRLEWRAIEAARELLADVAGPTRRMSHFTLGPDLGQCCGGVVQISLQRFARGDRELLEQAARSPEPETTRLWLYGAGHVGQALVRVLADLPFQVTLIDERAELLPEDVPANVRTWHAPRPLESLHSASRDLRYLVMTHDHALDYALCKAILDRDDFAWLGLIGSKSKGARFRSRLAREGVSEPRIARLVCPIGVDGVDSKWPAAIAVAVAAQLLQQGERGTPAAASFAPIGATLPLAPPAGPATCADHSCQSCAAPRPVK